VKPTPIAIQAHPPERRRRPVVVAPCCCCCCCCCCLHTVGSLVGAGVASRVRAAGFDVRSEEEFWASQSEYDRAASEQAAVRLYWYLLTGIATVIGLVSVTLLGEGGQLVPVSSASLLWAVIILLLFFPLIQLGTSFLTAIVVACASDSWFPDRAAAFKRVGKLTMSMVAGAVIGIVAMVGIAAMMGAFR
jgi:hypothetical protein